MESILQNEKECYICGSCRELECHHVFGGANRAKSEKYGLKIWLCHTHHNEPPQGIHYNKTLMDGVRGTGQKAFEEMYGHERFMEEFGRNYL